MLRLALVTSLLLLPELSLADVTPPEVASCENRRAGDSCSLETYGGKIGRCQMGEQCRPKYPCEPSSPCGKLCSPALVCKESKDSKGGGCSVASARPAERCLGLLLGLGLLVALAGRRRWSSR